MEKNEIVLFESEDGAVSLPVSVDSDTVWLSLLQMAQLFGKDKTVIFRHVKNAIADGEIDPKVTSAKFAMVTPHGAIAGKTRIQVALPQGWHEAYRRPHTRRAHRDDSRIQAAGEGTDGQPCDDISEVRDQNDC